MKTNQIIILIDNLEESQKGKMPELERLNITVQELLALNNNESVLLHAEDVFIGSSATWEGVKERIEEYLQLSYLREGRLEIIYFSVYDALTRLYTCDAHNYFHFYNDCVRREEIEKLVHSFPFTFPCEFVNRSTRNAQKPLADQVKSKRGQLMKTIQMFLTTSSSQRMVNCA